MHNIGIVTCRMLTANIDVNTVNTDSLFVHIFPKGKLLPYVSQLNEITSPRQLYFSENKNIYIYIYKHIFTYIHVHTYMYFLLLNFHSGIVAPQNKGGTSSVMNIFIINFSKNRSPSPVLEIINTLHKQIKQETLKKYNINNNKQKKSAETLWKNTKHM